MNKPLVIKRQITDTLKYKGKTMINIDINYPNIERTNQIAKIKINSYYDKKAQKLYKRAKTKLYYDAVKQYEYAISQGFPFNAYQVVSVFETNYNCPPLLSIYEDVYEYTGGAHGNTVKYSDTWEINIGKRLLLSNLFKRGYDYRRVILKEIEKQAIKLEQSGQIPFFDDYKLGIKKYFDEKNYYLTTNGLAIYYPLYTIAPYVAGIIVFIIPYYIFGKNLNFNL